MCSSIKKILLTGGSGFLGQYVFNELIRTGYEKDHIFVPRSSQYDLRSQYDTDNLLKYISPDCVIHLAASVGGIGANMANPGKFFYDNAIMGINLIEAARKYNVKKFVLIGTVCSYPKTVSIPFNEYSLWDGFPEETNAPYGIAKKALGIMLQAYHDQYGLSGTYLMPANLYGPYDNFNENSSHVIPALIKKIVDAKDKGGGVNVWGDGSATREFLYVDDAAKAIVKSINIETYCNPINIGNGQEVSIKNLVDMIKKLTNYSGDVVWDASKPNGQPRRCLNNQSSYEVLGWKAETSLENGLKNTIDWYLSNV